MCASSGSAPVTAIARPPVNCKRWDSCRLAALSPRFLLRSSALTATTTNAVMEVSGYGSNLKPFKNFGKILLRAPGNSDSVLNVYWSYQRTIKSQEVQHDAKR